MRDVLFLMILLGGGWVSHGETMYTNAPYLSQPIFVENVTNVAGLVKPLEDRCDIVVCFECGMAGDLFKDISFGDRSVVNVNDVLDRLTLMGFSLEARDKILLVRSPDVINLKDNPMDVCFKSFSFNGNRLEFIRKLVDEGIHIFPMNQPAVGNPYHKDKYLDFGSEGSQFALDIKGEISLRELLLRVGVHSQGGWYVEIREPGKEKISEVKMPDGTISYSWDGRMNICFFDDMMSEVESSEAVKVKENSLFSNESSRMK